MKRYGKYERKASWIVIWYGQYGRKACWIVKRYEKYGRKVGWIVKVYWKYGRKLGKDMKNMEESQLNSDKIGTMKWKNMEEK